METPPNPAAAKEFQVIGVSRSGRVRKKSSKLLDFQSPDEVEKKLKRAAKQGRSGSGGVRGGSRYLNSRGSAVGSRRRTLSEMSAIDDSTVDDEDLHDDDGMDATFEEDMPFGVLTAADSDDELDELVADLVEGVEAESMEHHVDDSHDHTQSKVRQSLYMTEKANKRKMLKDGKVVTGKVERKDKGKSRHTAYSLWAREFRKTSKFSKNQDLDFSNAARRLGELWANVSNKEKSAWRRKAKIQATKAKAREKSAAAAVANTNSASSFMSSLSPRATTSRTKKLAAERQKSPPPRMSPPASKRKRYNSHARSPGAETDNSTTSYSNAAATHGHRKAAQLPRLGAYRTEAVDVAAHLKLLGESLTIIGERLKEHDGQIAVAGSLSVLLDSLLCSLGPLLCLTKHIPIPILEKQPQLNANLAATLDNIAYVMPGL